MAQGVPVTGVPLEEVALSLEELARACDVEPEWVIRHIRAGVLGETDSIEITSVRFRSGDLLRARGLLSLEQIFDANEEIAALVLDLGDEIHRLRARLRVLEG
ncbi:MAG: MerR family transcriptional regulator [Massilia sp.]|nr:MerR family transcriptional regulator [Massilia sp.]MDB5953002.1 MerR family transcriptional regulator [Massilia sp.]